MRRAYVMNLLKQVSGRLASVAALSAGVLLASLPAHAGCDAEVRRCWAPAVTINAPGAGSTFSAPGLVNFSVYAEDVNAGQPITKVELYQNGALVGTSTSGGTNYSFSVSGLAVGSYSFQVKAYDRNYTIAVGGLKSPAGSASVSITVNNPSPPPTIWVNRTRPMIVGQAATLNWGSTNATSVSYNCTSSGGGFAGAGTVATSGGNSGPPDPAWVGHPSTCVWTATGPGGSASTTETLETINPPPAPTISVNRNPSPLVAGGSYTLNWSTTDTTSVNLSCTASGTGFVTSGGLETNGYRSGVASSAWVGYPSTCIWTATGPGGSKSVTETMTTVLPPAPTISISRTTMEAGENSTLYWASTNADSVSYSCTANGTGFKGSGTMPTVNGNQTSVSSADWVGYPSTCIWTATGPGGSKSYTETVVTNPSSNTPPTASLKASPTNVRIAVGGTANIVFTGNGADSNGQVVKLELFRDNGSGYSATPVATATGTAATLAFNYTYAAAAGSYRFKLRATDNKGAYTDSAPIVINVTDSPLLGTVNGVRFNTADKPELIGWVCQANTATPLNIQLFANAPASLGGTLIGSGTASLSEEVDNVAIQNACGTPGVGHRFRLDLSAYTNQFPGAPIYVIGLAATGNSNIVLPCDDNTCTMPGGMRIGLTTPVNNDRYTAPANVFGRFKLFNATGPYDEVSVFFDSEWIPASADTAANTFYASKANLPARAAPYRIQAKVRQGNITLYSPESLIYVDSGAGSGSITLTSSNSTYQAPASIDLAATLGATTYGVTSVKFSQGGVDIGSGTFSNGAWRYTVSNAVAGSYSFTATAYAGTTLVTTSSPLSITVTSAQDGTPVAISQSIEDAIRPYLNLPDAGTLPGKLAVSGGAANFSLPITLPPGTAGVVPSVSLGYSSQAGNGLAGMGWSLSASSQIHRCGKTLAQDDRTDTVRFTNADRLCLDGQRLLLVNLPVNDANYWSNSAEFRTEIESFSRITRANGGFVVETKAGQTQYYGDTDNSRLKSTVPEHNNLVHGWALRRTQDRSSNRIDYEYLDNTGIGDGKTGEHVLSRISWGGNDVAGQANYAKVEFDYGQSDRPDTQIAYLMGSHADHRKRLERIKTFTDTDASGANGTPGLVYTLTYELSPSSGRSLLQSVQACDGANMSTCLPATTFSWGKPDPAAKQEFVSLGIWKGPNIEAGGDRHYGNSPTLYYLSGDFNGDGKTDLLERYVLNGNSPKLFMSTGAGFDASQPFSTMGSTFAIKEAADFDGDGQTDLLVGDQLPDQQEVTNWRVCYSHMRERQGTGQAPFDCIAVPFPAGQTAKARIVKDLNADGRADLYVATDINWGVPSASVKAHMCLSTGSGFNCIDVAQQPDRALPFPNDANMPKAGHASADFDGDGRADDLLLSKCVFTHETTQGSWECPFAQAVLPATTSELGFKWAEGTWFALPTSWSGVVEPTIGGSLTADLNGDGYSDIVMGVRKTSTVQDPTVTYTAYGCYSKGDGNGDCVKLPESGYRYSGLDGASQYSIDPYVVTVADIDGDGQPDVLRQSRSSMIIDPQGNSYNKGYALCRMGPGMQSAQCVPWDWKYTIQSSVDDNKFDTERLVPGGDFTGNGQQNFVIYRRHDDWEIFGPTRQAKVGEALDKLVAVTNGQNQTDRVEYSQSKDAGVYSQAPSVLDSELSDAVAYPLQRQAPGGDYVVSKLVQANGVAEPKVTAYRYAGSAVHQQGHGSQGYRVIEEVSVNTGIRTLSTYRQDAMLWQTAGQIERVRIYSPSHIVLSDAAYGVQVYASPQANGTTTQFVYNDRVFVERHDLDGSSTTSALTCTDYNIVSGVPIWGNVTSQTVLTAENRSSVDVSCVQAPTISGVWKTQTVRTYLPTAPDAAPWMHGLIDVEVLTQVSPIATALPRTRQFGYESNGLPRSETVEPNDPAYRVLTTFDRRTNPFGLIEIKQQQWRNPNSGITEIRSLEETVYEGKGRFPYKVKNALGHTETQGYDHRTGVKLSSRNPNNLLTTWAADAFGRKLTELHPDGREIHSYLKMCSTSCPVNGSASISITDAFNGTSRSSVPSMVFADAAGHVLRTQSWGFDGQAIVTDSRFDERGRLYEIDHPRFELGDVILASRTNYDDLDRPTLITTFDERGAPLYSKTEYFGQRTVLTNPILQVKTDTRDATGKLVQTKDAKGGIMRFEHDPYGALAKTIDPQGNQVVIEYDKLGRKFRLTDPDLGSIQYDNDPLGRTWRQISPRQSKAKEQTIFTFDLLDRMTSRIETDLKSYWVFDTAANGIGQLAEAYTLDAQDKKDYQRLHSYDEVGRPKATTTYLDVKYTSTNTYDVWGRPVAITHQRADGTLKVFENRYNNFGYLTQLIRGSQLLWEAKQQDAANRVLLAQLGNGLAVGRAYDSHTGRQKRGLLLANQNANLLEEAYTYDALGNVDGRTQYWDGSQIGFNESFSYDILNRLATSQVLGHSLQIFTYDDIGNVLTKTGVGSGIYAYPTSGANSIRPHAVINVPGVGDFSYDDNGNLIVGAGRTLDWTSFDMPLQITKAGNMSRFAYGPEHQRTRQTKNGVTNIYYAGAMEVEVSTVGTAVKTYWPNGLGVEIDKSGSTTDLNWTHVDRLGSVVAISSSSGKLKEKLAYDAWGKRRSLDGGPLPGSQDGNATPDVIDGVTDNKGFTGHEMLDDLDLVHMNGRIYDPFIARVMSADPLIQDPEHSQSYNRYTYVWNNPTNNTDPTGFATDCVNGNDGKSGCNDAGIGLGVKCSITVGKCDGVTMVSGAPTPSNNGKSSSNGGNDKKSAAGEVKQNSADRASGSTNGRDPSSFKSAVYDTGKAVWNAGLGIVEGVPNLMTGALPGARDYWAFAAGARAEYDTPAFGAVTEALVTLGTFKMLGEMGAASRKEVGETLIIPKEKANLMPEYQAAAENGTLIRTDPSTVRTSGFRKALEKEKGAPPGAGFDADHKIELCVNGPNCAKTNGQWLQSGPNRAAGAKIGNQVKSHPVGTKYTNVKLEE